MRPSAKAAVRPSKIHFVTYTTRYNHCFWLTIDGLEQHYERAEVDGTRSEFKTRNIAALTLDRARQSRRSTARSPDVAAASLKKMASGAPER